MRDIPLTVLRGGINRNRTKGGVRADVLYDFVNGHLTEEGTAVSRPGTSRQAALDTATKGLVSFDGLLNVFCHEIVDVPAGYRLHVLSHPDQSSGTEHPIERIHFASGFMGFLYVVAEFDDGVVRHFWLQTKGVWSPDTVYKFGDLIEPTVANGLVFQPTRAGSPFPSWAARVPRAVGGKIEPTVYNDFYYEVITTFGDSPASGDVEPDFPVQEGATVVEDVDGAAAAQAVTTQPPDSPPPIGEVVDRYGTYTGGGRVTRRTFDVNSA